MRREALVLTAAASVFRLDRYGVHPEWALCGRTRHMMDAQCNYSSLEGSRVWASLSLLLLGDGWMWLW